MIALLAGVALGADVLPETLDRWARLAREGLVVDDVRPYRTVLAVDDLASWRVEAEFGSMLSESGGRSRPTRVEVVLGSDALASSRFRGSRVVAQPSLPIDDLPLAIERDLWLATDASFKAAIKQLEVKRQALAGLGSPWPADRSPPPPVIALAEVDVSPPDADALRSLALDGSARFQAFPGLRTGRIDVYASDGRSILATSDGTRTIVPAGYVAVYAWCDVLRDDGVAPWAFRQWVVRSVADLPPRDLLFAELDAMAKSVLDRAPLPVAEYYEGPVVFEGQAAAALLRSLVIPEVSGTPPEPQAGRTYAQLTRSGPRLGRRLLPRGWSVSDVPDRSPFAPAYDRQGVPTGRVDLVADGQVEALLMNDVPRADLAGSTGNARGSTGDGWNARPWHLVVEPDRLSSDKAFARAVDRARQDADLDRVLVVRRLSRQAGDGSVPGVTDAVWRAPDGTEEPVLTLEFQSADRRILRDLTAASGEWTDTFLLGSGASTSGLPTGSTTPMRLLVSQLEAVFPGTSNEPALYPAP